MKLFNYYSLILSNMSSGLALGGCFFDDNIFLVSDSVELACQLLIDVDRMGLKILFWQNMLNSKIRTLGGSVQEVVSE